ncbi:RIP metalloprotease RseP [Enterococcus faecalis]|nr:RIP metalloprotease RseP [Enterococcus faecalis]
MKTIITFIIVFGILVLVHEFGHFYFAKRAGILVR